MKGKHAKKNKKVITTRKIAIFILFIVLILSSYYILSNKYNIKNEKEKIEELTNIIEEDSNKDDNTKIEKLKKLQKQYPEMVAWLEIEGANISYPVMQTNNNDYYVEHNYKKEKAKSGSIFLNKDYNWSLPSSNLLMYGHNMKDGSMFGNLLKYKDESFYKKNPTIKFTTKDEESEYEIIAVFLSRVYYKSEKNVFKYYNFINAKNEEEYNEYIENSKNQSLYDTGKTAKYGDQLMTLSTCEYSQEDGRFAVVARKKY